MRLNSPPASPSSWLPVTTSRRRLPPHWASRSANPGDQPRVDVLRHQRRSRQGPGQRRESQHLGGDQAQVVVRFAAELFGHVVDQRLDVVEVDLEAGAEQDVEPVRRRGVAAGEQAVGVEQHPVVRRQLDHGVGVRGVRQRADRHPDGPFQHEAVPGCRVPYGLEGPVGVPIGALSDATYTDTVVELAPDDRVLLYTDGLLSRRDTPATDGLDVLLRAGFQVDLDDIEALVDHVTEKLGSEPYDDLCLVTAQVL